MPEPLPVAPIDDAVSPRRLRRSPRLYEAITQVSDHGILVVDRAGKISYASRQVEKFIGVPHHDLVGTSMFDQVEPDEAKFAMACFASKLATPRLRHHGVEIHLDGPTGRQQVRS